MAKGRKNDLWISFKGVKSTDIGVRVTQIPAIQIAEERGKAVEIPGRDGQLWLSDNSYKAISLRIELEVSSTTNLSEVTAWLSGSGNLILSTLADYYWKARIVKGFDVVSGIFLHGNYRTTVEFICQPFRYQVGDPIMEPITSATIFNGMGTAVAKPIITVNGSGNINLMINRASVLITGIDEYITLDCDAMMAYKGDVNMSPNITIMSEDDEWPALTPGSNEINWSTAAENTGSTAAEEANSYVTNVIIQPNWRWR